MTKFGWRVARRLAVVHRLRAGDTVDVVSKIYEVRPSTVSAWLRDAEESGILTLIDDRASRPAVLSARELRVLREKMENTWMSAGAFAQLVRTTFRRTISKATTLRYLSRLGVVPARRLHDRFAVTSPRVQKWRDEQLPLLVERAAQHQATLAFVDAARIEEERPVRTAFTASHPRGGFFYVSFPGGPEPSIAAAFVRRVAERCPQLWLLAPNESPFRDPQVPRLVGATRLLLF